MAALSSSSMAKFALVPPNAIAELNTVELLPRTHMVASHRQSGHNACQTSFVGSHSVGCSVNLGRNGYPWLVCVCVMGQTRYARVR